MTIATRTQHIDAPTIRRAIREHRIDRIADNIQHSLGIRDATILAIIDPEVSDTEFARLVDTPQFPESQNIMDMRLTRAFTSQGVTDPQDARRYADQLAINGHGLGYAQLLATASYIHWACGDTHTASRLAHDALDHEPACSLAAIVISALRRDIQWAA